MTLKKLLLCAALAALMFATAATAQEKLGSVTFTEAISYFARALGAARAGDTAAADNDVQQLQKIEDGLKTAKQIGLTIPPNVLVRAVRVQSKIQNRKSKI